MSHRMDAFNDRQLKRPAKHILNLHDINWNFNFILMHFFYISTSFKIKSFLRKSFEKRKCKDFFAKSKFSHIFFVHIDYSVVNTTSVITKTFSFSFLNCLVALYKKVRSGMAHTHTAIAEIELVYDPVEPITQAFVECLKEKIQNILVVRLARLCSIRQINRNSLLLNFSLWELFGPYH